MKTCNQCGKEYEPKRATSQYCSSGCRVQAKRNKDKLSVTATESHPVTLTPNCNANPDDSVTAANKETVQATVDVTLTSSTQPSHAQTVNKPVSDVADTLIGMVTGQTIHEQQAAKRGVNTVNIGKYKLAQDLGQHEVNRVPLPGDADYSGVWL